MSAPPPAAPHPERPRRLGYLGSPELAVGPLVALHEAGFEIPLVVSQPDARRGRGSSLSPSPVKAAALDLGLPVSDVIDDLLDPALGIELGVVVAFGRIIKPDTLARLAMVNLHLSLLPRWRGAAPIERAILAGDPETGACVMAVEEGLDTGGVFSRAAVPIGEEETLSELTGRLVETGTELLVRTLLDGLGAAEPQEGEPTYASKLVAADHRLDWSQPADTIHRVIRLERAWTTFRDKRLRIRRASRCAEPDPSAARQPGGTLIGDQVVCGDGQTIQLGEVQPEGKAGLSFEAWRNGAQPTVDDVLGS